MRYLIKFSYDGCKFNGFQRLNDLVTVQKTLEDALSIINKKNAFIKGAGRTDRGVHALGQCASFDLDYEIPVDRLKSAINSIVRPYINIVDVFKVDSDFHARFNVIKKKYLYKINTGDFNIFDYDYVYQLNRKLDIDKMIEASKMLIGVHDFRNFVSGERDNYINNIENITFDIVDDEINICFVGKSFYRYMVRNLVGVLIQVGLGNIAINDVFARLDKLDSSFTFYTAPSCGLYLLDIVY